MQQFIQTNHRTAIKSVRFVLISTLFAGAFFVLTNPSQASPVLILAGSMVVALLLYAWSWMFVVHVTNKTVLARYGSLKLAALVAAPPVYVILMQSIGQLNLKDILAVIPLAVVLYFYMVRSVPSA